MADKNIDRKAFRSLACGLDIVSAVDNNGRKCGCIINTFLQVSSEPPRVIISINKSNFTTHAIEESGEFNISVLSQSATMELISRFGFRSSADIEKFADTPNEVAANGVPYVTQSTVAAFSVKVYEKVDVGTHVVFFGNVEDSLVLSDEDPMTYAYYHNVIRGKTPPKAASFNPDEPTSTAEDVKASKVEAYKPGHAPASIVLEAVIAKDVGEALQPRTGWQCSLCGHIVEGYPDGLPDDFRCPMCGMGREFFERVYL